MTVLAGATSSSSIAFDLLMPMLRTIFCPGVLPVEVQPDRAMEIIAAIIAEYSADFIR